MHPTMTAHPSCHRSWAPLLALAGVLALVLTLVPASRAEAAHFGMLEVTLDISEPDQAQTDDEVGIVSDSVEFEITATNTSDEDALADTSVALDLPEGFTYTSAEGPDNLECQTFEGQNPDVRCELGDLADSETVVVTADATGRTASSITAVAYGVWDDFPAVFAGDNEVLADTTLDLVDTTDPAADDEVSFEVRNTGDQTNGENVTVEVLLPDTAQSVTATVAGDPDGDAMCAQLAKADDNVICQDLTVIPTGATGGAVLPGGTVTPEITISGLDSQDVVVEAKGDNTTRAALGYSSDGSAESSTAHVPAERTAGDTGNVRTVQGNTGVIVNRAISLPATEFTPVGGEVNLSVDDEANTGLATVEWVEGGVRYSYEAEAFRNLQPEVDYFQDGGVNFDSHQHGDTFRPSGPDALPDLYSQVLVYAEGTLTVQQPDGTTEEFDGVGMHAMNRQAAVAEDDLEPFQNWSDKGPFPARTDTIEYGGPVPPVPTNLALTDVLFANTPNGDQCVPNGIAGPDCNTDLGEFVRFMTFAQQTYVDGFNSSGFDLTAADPTETVTERYQSFNPLAGDEGAQSAVMVGLTASAQIFATDGAAADGRDAAEYAVLGRDDIFADSLAGSGLAAGRGPILFTPTETLDPVVRAELHRVLPDGATVYVLGSDNAIAASTETTLEQDGFVVERLGGETRFETAQIVAETVRGLNPDADEQLLVRGFQGDSPDETKAWADSISGGAYAADQQIPVILTRTEDLHPAAQRALDADSTTYVLGGAEAVSEATEASADERSGEVVRISGETRVETAIEVSRQLFGRDADMGAAGDEFVISPGYPELGWAYGLAAAGFSANADAPLLLLGPTDDADRPTLTPSLVEYLDSLGYTADASGYAVTSSSLPTDYLVFEVLDLLRGDEVSAS